MSCNYAEGLSSYANKGILGIDEVFEDKSKVVEKCEQLAEMIRCANRVVVHTGAGISTAAGIPDFRGPNGVWTLEKKGVKPKIDLDFNDAIPTVTHMALKALLQQNRIQFIVSQNIDGLHLKSGVPRHQIAELHGNMFVDRCFCCEKLFVRNSATRSVGQKCSGIDCPAKRFSGRKCKGKLFDTILDWDHDLPAKDLQLSDLNSSMADLSICLGTTLQIKPSGEIPLKTKKSNGQLVIVNLQPTKYDKHADLVINSYVDEVMKHVMSSLNLPIPEYDRNDDPTKIYDHLSHEWTLALETVTNTKNFYKQFRSLRKKPNANKRLKKC